LLLEGKIVVVKLEMSTIVELGQSRTVWVVALQVHVVLFGLIRCATCGRMKIGRDS